MTADLLVAEGISAGYGSTIVLNEVSLRVAPGEVVALLGANGAGKTTTLRALSGELPLAAGRVLWNGSPWKAPVFRRARRGLGYVTEERAVFMTLTCAENLRLGSGGIEGALAVMPELEPLLDRRVAMLSGGEQQYLAVARALAAKPSLLLADELSLGLAPIVVERLHAAARRAADEGAGVLLVEQHVSQALAFADRAYVMQRGRIVLEGTGQEFRGRLAEIEDSYLSGL